MGSDSELTHPTDKAMINAAHRLHHKDGEIEIDKDTDNLPTSRVSRGDDPGAYVLAWVWVDDSTVTEEDKE